MSPRAFDTMTKSPVIPVVRLLINLASAEAKICYILSIDLSSHSSILLTIILKSSFKESNVTAIEILSQMSQFGIIAARSRLTKNCTSANRFMTPFLKPFGLLICA